jgi:hypothetical protein
MRSQYLLTELANFRIARHPLKIGYRVVNTESTVEASQLPAAVSGGAAIATSISRARRTIES